MNYHYLSYPLAGNTPVYGGAEGIRVERIGRILRRGNTNLYKITMRNHCGTHIDAPNHFFRNGKKICDYSAKEWVFERPLTIKVSLKPAQILKRGSWKKMIPPDTDILLFKSGWHRFRQERKYCLNNPGVHPEVGLYLKRTFPKLRAVGIDWISISSYQHRALGREAHRAFLSSEGKGHPILIIEDMDLSGSLKGLKEITVLPLRVKDIDSSPCTVLGKIA